MAKPIEPLGFTKDGERAAFKVRTTQGEDAIFEVALADLPEIGFIAAQVADIGAERAGVKNEPPVLPIWKWELGVSADVVVMRLHLDTRGAHAFRMSKSTALELAEGLREAAGQRVQHTAKPN